MAKKVIREYYEVSRVKPSKNRVGWADFFARWDTVKYIGEIPVKDKKEALMWAYKYANSQPMKIERTQDIIDTYGDNDSISKPIGVVKEVQRKSGRAVVFYNIPTDSSQDLYMADLTPNGTLKNKRGLRD